MSMRVDRCWIDRAGGLLPRVCGAVRVLGREGVTSIIQEEITTIDDYCYLTAHYSYAYAIT